MRFAHIVGAEVEKWVPRYELGAIFQFSTALPRIISKTVGFVYGALSRRATNEY